MQWITLWMLGLKDEFGRARDWVAASSASTGGWFRALSLCEPRDTYSKQKHSMLTNQPPQSRFCMRHPSTLRSGTPGACKRFGSPDGYKVFVQGRERVGV